jgi:hypothetical protein
MIAIGLLFLRMLCDWSGRDSSWKRSFSYCVISSIFLSGRRHADHICVGSIVLCSSGSIVAPVAYEAALARMPHGCSCRGGDVLARGFVSREAASGISCLAFWALRPGRPGRPRRSLRTCWTCCPDWACEARIAFVALVSLRAGWSRRARWSLKTSSERQSGSDHNNCR